VENTAAQSWWLSFNPTHLKNMQKTNWIMNFPRDPGEKFQKCVQFHHLESAQRRLTSAARGLKHIETTTDQNLRQAVWLI